MTRAAVSLVVLALAAGDSLPFALQDVEGPRQALTVQDYLDPEVRSWCARDSLDFLAPVQQWPTVDSLVVVLVWPRSATGVEVLPPVQPEPPRKLPAGLCGRLFSWGDY